MKIIGITGKAGAGKDTTFVLLRELLEEQGFRVKRLGFAGKLKDICVLLFGWDRDRLDYDLAYKESILLDNGSPDPACALLGMSRREAMQKIGTEAMRDGFHSNIWIIALRLAILRGDYDDVDYGFIPDCRFINELQFVRELNGTLIQVKRPTEEALTEHSSHISELEWMTWTSWDFVISNPIDATLTTEQNQERYKGVLRDMILEKIL